MSASLRPWLLSLLALVLWGVGGVPVRGQEAGRRVALVIGVDRYAHLGPEGQLNGAVRDAKMMAATLRSLDPPFETELLTDSDWKVTQDTFDQFLDRAAGATCTLVYFAGHGVEYHGANYLLVGDTDVSSISADVERMKRRLATTSLALQSWVDSLDQTGAQVKVVILDCCRDNPLRVESGAGTRSLVGGSQGLAQVRPPSGTLISYSADAGQRANDGLFTEVLTRHMRSPGTPLLQVFAATREEVSATSLQWASEDEAQGIHPDARRVHHEPAEYTKLNVSGTKFAFSVGPPSGGISPEAMNTFTQKFAPSTAPGMAPAPPALKSLEELGVASPGNPTSPSQGMDEAKLAAFGKITKALEAARTTGKGGSAPALPSGFSLMGAMEGQAAGEQRTIHGIPLVWCPPGSFSMGPAEGEQTFMETQKSFPATLTRGFWIAQFETTQDQWRQTMGDKIAEIGTAEPTHPATSVSWDDAQAWIFAKNQLAPLPFGWRWALPTEAQWEYACRAGTETPFSFGSSLDGNAANCDGKHPYQSPPGPSLGRSAPVGSYPPNPWRLHDMHGNVAEWVQDHWGGLYPSGPAKDPLGPETGEERVLRGGSWAASALGCRSAYRAYGKPHERLRTSGFRAVIVRRD